MKANAIAKNIHISPRKTRLVASLIRGLSVDEARKQLMFSKKDAAKPALKVLNSAVANAEHNLNEDASNLFVLTSSVNEGPTFKRYRPRARGASATIRRRMSHISITVGTAEDRKGTAGKAKKITEVNEGDNGEDKKKPETKKTVKK
ncbi:MAG: 50S ribosomal protein L22 [bacterium]